MCFTWKGRLTARLISLTGPALATLVFWLATGQADYWVLFGFMAVVGLTLDVTLYNMLISYQPRWLTLGLGAGEYLILREVVMWPWPAPLIVRLFEREAAWFYVCGWVLAQVILHAVMPVLWLSWGDDGGELRSSVARRPSSIVRGWRWGTLAQRRQAFALALLGLGLAALPTLVGAWTCPPGMRYTGLLVNTASHLSLLADLTRRLGYSSGPSGGLAEWVRAWPEFLDASGDLPLIPIYHATRAVTGLLALAGAYGLVQRLAGEHQAGASRRFTKACALVYALLLPALIAATPLTLLLLAVILFGLAALPLPSMSIRQWVVASRWSALRPLLLAGLVAPGLAVWLVAWAGLARSPVAYLDEGEWQALAWLHQSTATDAPVVADPRLAPLVTALAGRPTLPAPDPGRSVYVLGRDAACARGGVSFQSRSVCIWWLLSEQD